MHTYRAETSRYCSKACWNHRAAMTTCLNCGCEFKDSGRKASRPRTYCSRDCAFAHMRGDKAPRWKDGKSLERDRARSKTELVAWRKAVYMRDNYRCRH